MLEAVQEQVSVISKEYNEALGKIIDEFQTKSAKLYQGVFDTFTDINSFGWTQYTPWFNDGDTCEFGVNTWDPYVNEVSYYYELDEEEKAEFSLTEERFEEIQKAITKFIDGIPEQILQQLYGDHCMITVKKDETGKIEVDVSEYEHD